MNSEESGISDGIVTQKLSKEFGTTHALDNVNVTFRRGTIHGLLGRNGAGKTTLMSIICNHNFKSSGNVYIDGQDPAENAAVLGDICFVHEDQRWHDNYTADMILGSASRFYPNWDRQLAAHLAKKFSLPAATKVSRLSRGQRSALAITIVLASHAEYSFLDEPYLGLDPTARGIFYEELATTQADDPRTFIMSTHLIDECAGLMETVTILDQGHVSQSGEVDDVLSKVWSFTGMKRSLEPMLPALEILSSSSMGAMCSVVFKGSLDDRQVAQLRTGDVSDLRHATLQELVSAIGAFEPQSHEQSTVEKDDSFHGGHRDTATKGVLQ
ncbi:ATP-binding cassette domain-containing protein [Bifidobacterium aquikefiricola]|uniref:ABC transporter ATP-binding protein n=1 Tax=Bifidobacterium aquikefiricola TaxID=3059038 RepID=A0AB39U7A5_9BIFI